jgi:hypothetical protein
MMGRLREAEELGRIATTEVNNQSHIDSWAGPYARWVARISVASETVEQGREILDKLACDLKRFDAIDQVDILNAKCWLDSQGGHLLGRDVANMLKHLDALPTAVGDQLQRMGMLAFR